MFPVHDYDSHYMGPPYNANKSPVTGLKYELLFTVCLFNQYTAWCSLLMAPVIMYRYSIQANSISLVQYLFIADIGLTMTYLLNQVGVLTGDDGVDYYGEIHRSKWNCWVHTLFMPFTYAGFNLVIPALLNLKTQQAYRLQMLALMVYFIHYSTIDSIVANVYLVIYFIVVQIVNNMYKIMRAEGNRVSTIASGLIISASALVIQEIIGHLYGGDQPSRKEGVFNAILYAKYYSIDHMLSY